MNIETIFLSVLNGGLLLGAIVAAGATFVGFLPGGWARRERAKLRAELQERRIARLDEDDKAFFGEFSSAAKALGMAQNPRSGGLPEFIGTISGVEYSARAERDALMAMETLGFYPDSHIPMTQSDGQTIQIIHGIVRIRGTRDSQALSGIPPSTHAVVPWLHPRMPDALFTGSLMETLLALDNLDKKRTSEGKHDAVGRSLSLSEQTERQPPKTQRGIQIHFSTSQIELRKSRENAVPELLPLFELMETLTHTTTDEKTPARLRQIAREEEDPGNQALARVALASLPSWERMDEVLLVKSLVQVNPTEHAPWDRGKLLLERVTAELDEAERTPLVTLLSDTDLLAVHPLTHLLVSYLCLSDDPRASQALVASLSTSPPEACVAAAKHLSGQGRIIDGAHRAIRDAAERLQPLDAEYANQLLFYSSILAAKTGTKLGGRLTVVEPDDIGQLSLEASAGTLAMSLPEQTEVGPASSGESARTATEPQRRFPSKKTSR